MPAFDQSVRRQVGRRWSKISTPDLMALTISSLPASNALWSSLLHSNFTLGLRKGLKGSSVLRSWPYPVTWLTSPNHDLTSVRFFGVGKSLMTLSYLGNGATLVLVIRKPANSTSLAQN